MKGFPKKLATKEDVENILKNCPEYHNQLKQFLKRVLSEPETASRVVSYRIDEKTQEMIDIVTKDEPTENLIWERMGFKSRDEVKFVLSKLTKQKEVKLNVTLENSSF